MKKILFLWLFAFILFACSRQSSKESLETVTEMKLPDGYSVLKDDRQQLDRDFFVQYDLKFNADSTQQLIREIKSSKYYAAGHAQLLYDSIWYEDESLYKFETRNAAMNRKYEITFNPATGILNYVEYSESMKL